MSETQPIDVRKTLAGERARLSQPEMVAKGPIEIFHRTMDLNVVAVEEVGYGAPLAEALQHNYALGLVQVLRTSDSTDKDIAIGLLERGVARSEVSLTSAEARTEPTTVNGDGYKGRVGF